MYRPEDDCEDRGQEHDLMPPWSPSALPLCGVCGLAVLTCHDDSDERDEEMIDDEEECLERFTWQGQRCTCRLAYGHTGAHQDDAWAPLIARSDGTLADELRSAEDQLGAE